MRRIKGVTALALSALLVFGSAGSALAAEETDVSASVIPGAADDSLENGTDNGGVTGGGGATEVDGGENEDLISEETDSEDKTKKETGEDDAALYEAEGDEKAGETAGEIETEQVQLQSQEEQSPKLFYRVHVQTSGWNDWTENQGTIGTTGLGKRLEALQLKVEVPETKESQTEGTQAVVTGGIEYRVHSQTYGWLDWVKDGQQAGTTGQAKRLEAVQIRLTGELEKKYDIYYRTHCQTYGWLGWAKNGEKAGSLGYAKRMEALEIQLVQRGAEAPGDTSNVYKYPKISYQAHSQSVGWQPEKYDNAVAGVTGRSKRLEALKIKLPDTEYAGSIQYRTYVQTYGWQDWKQDGQQTGTTNQAKRIEAVEIKLTGDMEKHYDVYYSVHMAKIGWTNYAVNGETAGSTDLSKRIEAIKIQLVEKGGKAPDTSGLKFIEGYKSGDMSYRGSIQGKGDSGAIQMGGTLGVTGQSKRLENLAVTLNRRTEAMPSGTVKYAVHLSQTGWTGWSEAGQVSGCTDGSRGIEAVKFSLSGDLSKYYDIYYRAHVQKYGWLGWAKNGQAAGTSKIGYRLEALQVRLVSKDAGAPGANRNYYTEQRFESGPDAGMYARANLYSSSTPYIVMVDRANRKVGVYQGWQGAWKNVKYWSCTVGAPATPTVSGVFKVGSRGYYFDSGDVRCFWWTQFYNDYLFHSTTYYPNGAVADSRLGLALSHGCVRLNINDAKWIYDTIPSGSTVVVYN